MKCRWIFPYRDFTYPVPFIDKTIFIHTVLQCIFFVSNYCLQVSYTSYWLLPLNNCHRHTQTNTTCLWQPYLAERFSYISALLFFCDCLQSRSFPSNLFLLSLALGVRITSWFENSPKFLWLPPNFPHASIFPNRILTCLISFRNLFLRESELI